VAGRAVTQTMCICVPTATVWRWPVASAALTASSTVSVTLPPVRIASQTLTLPGSTLRSTGPASTRGSVEILLASDCQAMAHLLRAAILSQSPPGLKSVDGLYAE